jgi:large subunit ribosomal protein L6
MVNITPTEVKVKGPKGELTMGIHPAITVKMEDQKLLVARSSDNKFHRSLHGMTRSILASMVKGVNEGFQKRLEIQGLGYKANMQGKNLLFSLGYSHPIVMEPPPGITFSIEEGNQVAVSGIDKQVVGEIAAQIRGFRPPEPFKGKGVRYVGEHVRRKAGKAGKAAAK